MKIGILDNQALLKNVLLYGMDQNGMMNGVIIYIHLYVMHHQMVLLDLFNQHFPLQPCTYNRNRRPINSFMTSGLLKSRRTKLKLARKAKKHPNGDAPQKFRTYRNIFNSLVKT